MKDTAFYYVTIISLWMKTYGIITPMEAFNGHLYLVLLVFSVFLNKNSSYTQHLFYLIAIVTSFSEKGVTYLRHFLSFRVFKFYGRRF